MEKQKKNFVSDPNECTEIDQAYRTFATRFQEWDHKEYEKEQLTKNLKIEQL